MSEMPPSSSGSVSEPHGEPTETYGEPTETSGEPTETYGEPTETYGEPTEPPLIRRLEKAAEHQKTAGANVTRSEQYIKNSRQQVGNLQGKIREHEARLPGLIQKQQNADDAVSNLLLQVEKKYNLQVRRIEQIGPVVQGGTAKFQAVHDPLPDEVKVSWDTGGCPFTEVARDTRTDTIKVDTSAVAPGDYDISASLVLDPEFDAITSSSTVSTSEPLTPGSDPR